MKARYDQATDTLTLILRDAPVAESDEDKPGVILDYGEDGSLVSLEVLDASKRVEDPHSVTLVADAWAIRMSDVKGQSAGHPRPARPGRRPGRRDGGRREHLAALGAAEERVTTDGDVARFPGPVAASPEVVTRVTCASASAGAAQPGGANTASRPPSAKPWRHTVEHARRLLRL